MRCASATASPVDSYQRFLDLLLASPTRLTAVPPEEAYARHVEDALAGAPLLAAEPGRVIDVGSGTGVPGMVFALADPGRPVTLLEANGRKAAALRAMADELGLANVEVVAARAEAAGREERHRDAYAVAVCRALAPPPVAAELCLPFVRAAGLLVMWTAAADLDAVDRVAQALGAAVERTLPYGDHPHRQLVAIRKQMATPDRFPRRDGMAAKRPLS
jgi:16S rRNA (guanine527-N7)-methyltransferase